MFEQRSLKIPDTSYDFQYESALMIFSVSNNALVSLTVIESRMENGDIRSEIP